MKDRMDMRLEEMTAKIVKGAGLKEPTADFTSRIMETIEQQSQSTATVYTPLISKKMWWGIGIAVTAVVVFIISSNAELTLMEDMVTAIGGEIPQWELPKYNLDFAVPSSLVYGFLIMALLLAVEIPLLKRRYNW